MYRYSKVLFALVSLMLLFAQPLRAQERGRTLLQEVESGLADSLATHEDEEAVDEIAPQYINVWWWWNGLNLIVGDDIPLTERKRLKELLFTRVTADSILTTMEGRGVTWYFDKDLDSRDKPHNDLQLSVLQDLGGFIVSHYGGDVTAMHTEDVFTAPVQILLYACGRDVTYAITNIKRAMEEARVKLSGIKYNQWGQTFTVGYPRDWLRSDQGRIVYGQDGVEIHGRFYLSPLIPNQKPTQSSKK